MMKGQLEQALGENELPHEVGIGGFLGLDRRLLGREYYPDCPGFSTGRSCLGAILGAAKPEVVWLPNYTCPVVPDFVSKFSVRIERYSIQGDFTPSLSAHEVSSRHMIVVNNYCGLLNHKVDELSKVFGTRLIIDNAQAFWHRPIHGAWGFNSARKFFGVPDGAYLMAQSRVPRSKTRSIRTSAYLEARSLGMPSAYSMFSDAEESIDLSVKRMSMVSRLLLGAMDYEEVAKRRVDNYRILEEALSDTNRLHLSLKAGCVPLGYPYLPTVSIPHSYLHSHQIWVPQYWPDLDPSNLNVFESQLARSLLVLPVDQRMTTEHVERVIQVLRAKTEADVK